MGAAVVSALSSLFAAVGAVATLGVLFVPWQKSVSNSGILPGASRATYAYNHDEGRLRILDAAGALLTIGQRDRSGIFYDVHTGVPFAREIDGAVVFNSDITQGSEGAAAKPDAVPRTRTRRNEPRLCPRPGLDQPGSESASPRAKAYQEQIAFMVNGLKGLKFGAAINLRNPITGKIVHFDECDRRTGTMIEAKGPGLARVLGFPPGRKISRSDGLSKAEARSNLPEGAASFGFLPSGMPPAKRGSFSKAMTKAVSTLPSKSCQR